VQTWPDPLGRWTQRDLYPDAAVQYLKAVGRPLRILNQYNWGGYLMLHLPGSQVFIDGRANTLYDERIYDDWRTFLNAAPGLQTRLTRYTADVALLPDQEFARALQRLPRPWRVVYQDPVALILLPPGSPLAGALPSAEVIAQHPQFLQQRARARMARRDWQGAEELLREALRRDPLVLSAYGDLAAIKAQTGDMAGVDAVLEEARRAGGRREQNLSVLEGFFYAQRGETARALQAFRAGLPRGPFDNPSPVLERIRALVADPRRTSRSPG
jgi:tetratricopeptide (TPR) repeat protein